MMARAALAGLLLLIAAAPPREERDRSPIDVALSPDGRWALVANATANSASLVDLEEGKVAAEVAVGSRPQSVAWTGTTAVVTNFLSDDVTLLSVAPPKLEAVATVPVGDEPRGVAIAGERALVVLSGEDALAELDLKARRVTR